MDQKKDNVNIDHNNHLKYIHILFQSIHSKDIYLFDDSRPHLCSNKRLCNLLTRLNRMDVAENIFWNFCLDLNNSIMND